MPVYRALHIFRAGNCFEDSKFSSEQDIGFLIGRAWRVSHFTVHRGLEFQRGTELVPERVSHHGIVGFQKFLDLLFEFGFFKVSC